MLPGETEGLPRCCGAWGEEFLYPALLAGTGECLAAVSSPLAVLAETKHPLPWWHWGLKEGPDLGVAFCQLRPCGCPLHCTPMGLVSAGRETAVWGTGRRRRPGRQAEGSEEGLPAPLVEHEPGCLFDSQIHAHSDGV